MLNRQNHPKIRLITKAICSLLIVTFSFSNIQVVQAQDFSINQLPIPGTMLGVSLPFTPLALKGLIVNPNKPLEFQFIIDTGREGQNTVSIKDDADQLVKYFLAGLTIPAGDLWVNLSPYEKNRIVPYALGQTDLGRDLLAQDYILKQLTASLIYPERDLGKEFWARVYARAQQEFGTTNIPVNTFNKVWILPDQAEVFENDNAAYVTKSSLKVMLDEDYLAKKKHQASGKASSISSQIIRQIILPEIEKEVNTGKNFAPLRQIYQALILAKWYKETIQNGLLDALYTNKDKVAGVNVDDPAVKEEIYQRYLKAYKKGVFNYIKEDPTPDGQVVPRKYFSGGITQMGTFPLQRTHDEAMLSNSLEAEKDLFLMTVNIQNGSSNNGLSEKANPVGTRKTTSNFRNTLKKMAAGLMVAAPLFFASVGVAQAEVITHNSNGTLHVSVQQSDTFGQILLDAGYRGNLWSPNGVVSQLKSSVEKQIPTHDINRIGPGAHFNIPDPHFIDPDVRGYIQQLSQAIGHLNTVSRIFSTDKLKELDQLLSNVPQKVLDNEQANQAVNEIKQARADMDSNLFRLNQKGANLDSHGFHTGDTQRFSFTRDGQTQLKIVGDVHTHFKAAKSLMKPFLSSKGKGFNFSAEGSVRLGPVTVHLPGISVAPAPSNEGPIGLSGKVTVGHTADNPTGQVNQTPVVQSNPTPPVVQANPDTQKSIDQINTQLKAVQTDLDSLRQSHSNLLNENSDLKSKLTEAQQQIEGLKTAQKISDVAPLESKISDLNGQITDLRTQLDQATQKQGSIEQLKHDNEQLEGQLSDVKTTLKNQEARTDALEKRISSLEQHTNQNWWTGLGDGWKGIFGLLGILGIVGGIAYFSLYKNLRKLRQLKAEIQEKEAEAARLDEKIAAANTQLQNINNQTPQPGSTAIADEENKLKAIRETISTLAGQQGQYETTIQSLKDQIAGYQSEITTLEEQAKKAKDENAVFAGEIASTQSRIQEAGQKINESEGVIEELNGQILTLTQQKQNLESENAVKQEEKQRIEAQLISLNQQSENLTQRIETLEAQNTSLVDQERELKSSIEQKTAQLKDVDTQISAQEALALEPNPQIPILQDQKRQLEIELAKLSQNIADLNRELSQVQEKLGLAKTAVAGQESEKQRIQAELTQLEASIEQLKGQIATLDAEKQSLHAQVDGLNGVLAETQRSLLEAQETLKNLLTEIGGLEARKTALSTEEIPDLEGQRDSLRQEVEDLGKEKLRLTQELDALRKPLVVTKSLTPVEPADDVDEISLVKQEYTAIALQFQGVQDVADKDTFTELCDRLKNFTAGVNPNIRGSVSREREQAGQELRNASDRLVQAAKRIRQEIAVELQGLTQLDSSANFDAQLLDIQGRYPAEILAEFSETIKKTRESIVQKEQAAEKQEIKTEDVVTVFAKRYNDIIASVASAESLDDLEKINTTLTALFDETNQHQEIINILQPLQKAAKEAIANKEEEIIRTVSKSLYKRVPAGDFWMIFKRYLLMPWWIGRQLNHALDIKGLGGMIKAIYAKYPTVYDWFQGQSFYQSFKQQAVQIGLDPDFDKPGNVTEFKVKGDNRSYSLELADRSPEYLIRGYFSGDCTNPAFPFGESSFQSATLNHLVMPAFFNFKIKRGKQWVGNIYAVVVERNGKPVLLIDAIQIPWRPMASGLLQPSGGYLPFWLPTKLYPVWSLGQANKISDGAVEGLKQYAQEKGFAQLWHSSFVSNYYAIKDYYRNKYQGVKQDRFDDLNMMLGYRDMSRALKLGHIYVESNGNPSAWIVWERGKPQANEKIQGPSTRQQVVQKSPDEFVAAIGRGELVSPSTLQILKERFGITPSELARNLGQRLKESPEVMSLFSILASGINVSQWMRQNKQGSGYAKFESDIKQLGIDPQFNTPGLEIPFGVGDNNSYKLVLSKRDVDDLVRGYISGDCTNPGWQHASYTFNKYMASHMQSPGFLNFRIYRSAPHAPYEWIGNVYAGIIRRNGVPVLLIDAIQIPWKGVKERFGMQILPLPPPFNGRNPNIPFSVNNLKEAEQISDAIISALSAGYAPKYGFKETYLGFGSNFTPLVEHFYEQYAANYNELLPPSEAIQQSQSGEPPVENISKEIKLTPAADYSRTLDSLNFELVGLNKDKLDSFDNEPYSKRGFAVIKNIQSLNSGGTALYSFEPILGTIALAGWLIYLAYKGIVWLVKRFGQNNAGGQGRRVTTTNLLPVQQGGNGRSVTVANSPLPVISQTSPGGSIANVVSEGVLERRTVGAYLPITQDERRSLQLRLGSIVDTIVQGSIETWPQTFGRSFLRGRTKILWELPLPLPVSRIRREPSPRGQAVMILKFLKVWMDAGDARVVRDLRNGIEEAREEATTEALSNLDNISDERLIEILTTGYQSRFSKAINKNIDRFIKHVRRFQGPSPEERGLRVSREIEARYERFPRYLKWIFTQNPGIDNDPEIQELVKVIYDQMMRLPTFSAEIGSFAKEAFSESIKLNPELGFRIFEYMTKDLPTQDDIILRAQSQETFLTYQGGPIVDVEREQEKPIPAITDARHREEERQREESLVSALTQALQDFKQNLNKRRIELQSKEKDLKELTDAYNDAIKAGENYTADVLVYAKEGAEAEVAHLKQEVSSLQERIKSYETQIQNLGRPASGNNGGTTFYSFAPLPLALVSFYDQIKDFLTGYGVPHSDYVIIPLLVLSPWLITTTIRVIIRNIFPSKSEPIGVIRLLASKSWAWSLFAFPVLAVIYTPVIIRPWSLMGRQGLYSYWENKRPSYYKILKEEMKNLNPDFRAPGEKFRVAYDRKNVAFNPTLLQDPINDESTESREFLRQLSLTNPDLYKKIKNLTYGKRTQPEYRELYEAVTQEEMPNVMAEIITRVQNWNVPNDKRVEIIENALQIFYADKTKKIRAKVFGTKNPMKKGRFNAEYWQKILDYFTASNLIPANSKVSTELTSRIKRRISLFSDQTERPRRGLLQFYLSGVTYSDFFNGFISSDCTNDLTFFGFLSTKLDPAFMLFKIVENGRWVGNLYTMVLKDSDGREALLLDAFQLNVDHPLLNSDSQLKSALSDFLDKFKYYLAQQGFKELLISSSWISNRTKISEILPNLVKQQGEQFSSSFKKPGGARYRARMFAPWDSHLQTLGTVYENFSFSGYRINLPETPKEADDQLKQQELKQTQQRLKQLIAELGPIETQLQEKQVVLDQLTTSIERERNNNRQTTTALLTGELTKINPAVNGLVQKRDGLKDRIAAEERKLEEIKRGLGLTGKKVSSGAKAVTTAILMFGFLLANAQHAYASGIGDIDAHSWSLGGLILTFGTALGLFVYMFYKDFKAWFTNIRNGGPDIAGLIEGIYGRRVNNQWRTGHVVLDPKSQKQVDAIQSIADEFGYLFHPETENPDDLAFSIIDEINKSPLDQNMKDELMAALSLNLSWAKERVRFINSLQFTQGDSFIDQRGLVQKLSEYLGIPSQTGKEKIIRDYIISQLKKIGGSEYKIPVERQYANAPKNLVWDIPASENYKGEALTIALHAHLDTGTSAPTLLQIRGGSLIAEGMGKRAQAGLDDSCGLAVIMQAVETLKEKQIPHPALRIIFTAEEETGATGAHYLVRNHPEIFQDIDLLISIDGPLLNKKSPLAVKFINFGKAKEKAEDPSYKAVIETAKNIAGNENAPEQFTFSMGDEQAFKEVEGLRVAHFRANYTTEHAVKDITQLEHLTMLSEWVAKIAATLNKKPIVRPTKKQVARQRLVNSIKLISQDKIKQDMTKVIANSGKLVPGMEFFIYESFPTKHLLHFKYPEIGRLTLTEYTSGNTPTQYDVFIKDEGVFDTAGNIFIMEMLKSKTATVVAKDGRAVYLSSILANYAVPKEFNPEVGGLVVKDKGNPENIRVVEFPYKGYIQVNAVSQGLGRYTPGKMLVPFVHLGVQLEFDRLGRFKGLTMPNLYDIIKSRFPSEDVVLGFHTHPDDAYSPPRFSYLDLDGVRKQTTPVILPLQMVVGRRKSAFFHHYENQETKQIDEMDLNLDTVIKETQNPQEKAFLADFNKWLDSLSLYVTGEKRYTAKGKGMFTLQGRDQLEGAVEKALQEGRGYLVWGEGSQWKDDREEYEPEIRSIIGYLQGYASVNIPELGNVDIPKVLSSTNVVLIKSADGKPGLVVNHENSYQVAFCDILDNTIKIDGGVYSSLSYNYPEKAALLAHEAIELGAMRIAKEKNIPWTLELANKVIAIAENHEIRISGRNSNGPGSRLDERINEILGFEAPLREMRMPAPLPEKQEPKIALMEKDRNELAFADDLGVTDSLRKMLENLIQDPTVNLPARLEQFPPPIAREIRMASLFRKVKGVPINIDFLSALTMFFAKVFPNHVDKILRYNSKLFINIIDNGRSTFGATLRGNTIYIQRSCIEDIIGRRISVKEIYQAIEDKDRDVSIALFRILIHEIGGGFFKLSHESNEELEQLFLSMLSRTKPQLSPKAKEEMRRVNATTDLDALPRLDWANAGTSIHGGRKLSAPTRVVDHAMVIARVNAKNNYGAPALSLPRLHVAISKNGGIDLNQIIIHRTGKIIRVKFDQAQLNEFIENGFEGFTPVITNIIRIQNPLSLLGVSVSSQPKVLQNV